VTEARDAVLGRIRAALSDGAAVPEVPRAYIARGRGSHDELVARFVARVEETGGVVVSTSDPGAAVAAALAEHGASEVVVAPDLPTELRPDTAVLVEDDGLSPDRLDGLDGAVTTCAAACADTGTIALDGGPGQGRRAITLLPDLHVCVVTRDQIVATVPELFERLDASARAGRPIVLVSGPSATSDLGFERIEGVHGPRRFVVVLAPPATVH
jgi:L-lactate dehydrogenase complex protein LldG